MVELITLSPEALVNHLVDRLPDFYEAEDLAYAPRRECTSCKNCQDCRLRSENLTQEEREVVKWVEENMHLHHKEKKIHCCYPFNGLEVQQKSNYGQAIAFQKSVEKQLVSGGYYAAYQQEMEESLQRGAARPLSEAEIMRYKGPVHYITLFPVITPSKVSTKVRIVSNSAQKNSKSGLSLNDCIRVGPNALNGLVDVLLRWRGLEFALTYDLKKAYQSMQTGELENHLRRFVWRKDRTHPWQVYMFLCVNFGDQIAALILELGCRILAKHGAEIDGKASEQLRRNGYVDDIAAGEVRRI